MTGFDYLGTGPRMGYRTPLALEAAGVLESLHLDVWLRPGRKATLARSLLGQRAENRVISNIAQGKIHAHPEVFLLGRLRRRLALAGRDTTPVDALLIRRFRSIARRCQSPAVFGMYSCSVELFAGRACRVLEQLSPCPQSGQSLTKSCSASRAGRRRASRGRHDGTTGQRRSGKWRTSCGSRRLT